MYVDLELNYPDRCWNTPRLSYVNLKCCPIAHIDRIDRTYDIMCASGAMAIMRSSLAILHIISAKNTCSLQHNV